MRAAVVNHAEQLARTSNANAGDSEDAAYAGSAGFDQVEGYDLPIFYADTACRIEGRAARF